jgi:uncharacterized membrane protein
MNFDANLARDLVKAPTMRDAARVDAHLSVAAFAERHSQTIRRYFAKGGLEITDPQARDLAAQLWGYLHH